MYKLKIKKLLEKLIHYSKKTPEQYDVACIGRGAVDYYVRASEEWLREVSVDTGVQKGSTHPISREAFESVLSAYMRRMKDEPKLSVGGSAMRVAKGIANLGAKVCVMTCSGIDNNTKIFEQSLKGDSVTLQNRHAHGETPRELIAVTPDSERTLLYTSDDTHVKLEAKDVDTRAIARSKILHLEGSLLSQKKVLERAFAAANRAKIKTSFDLASFNFARENKKYILQHLFGKVDFLFGTREEMRALIGDDAQVDIALRKRRGRSFVFQGAGGLMLYEDGCVTNYDALPAETTDTTGAGDLFIAAILYSSLREYPLSLSLEMALKASSRQTTLFGEILSKEALQKLDKESHAHKT